MGFRELGRLVPRRKSLRIRSRANEGEEHWRRDGTSPVSMLLGRGMRYWKGKREGRNEMKKRDVCVLLVEVGESREEGKGNELLGVREDEWSCGSLIIPATTLHYGRGPEMTGTKHHQGKNSNFCPP